MHSSTRQLDIERSTLEVLKPEKWRTVCYWNGSSLT